MTFLPFSGGIFTVQNAQRRVNRPFGDAQHKLFMCANNLHRNLNTNLHPTGLGGFSINE